MNARDRERFRAKIRPVIEAAVGRSDTLLDIWLLFRATVLHEVTNPIQIEETRRGFYAGAGACFELMMRVSVGEVSEDQGAAMLAKLQEELDGFATDMKQVQP